MIDRRCGDPPPPGLITGIELYNQGEYYECHEVLEDIWRAEPDDVRFLYQGILQVGVGFHHLSNQNWRGAVGLLEGGIDKLNRFQPRCMGVDTAALLAGASQCLALLRDLGRERIAEFDWSLVPRIEVRTTQPGDPCSASRGDER